MVSRFYSNYLDIKFFSEDSKSYIEKKIDSFLALEADWHFGEGRPPSVGTAEKAINFVKGIMAVGFDIDAFPGITGEISLTFYHDKTYLEVVFESDGSISFCHEKDRKEINSAQDLDIRTVRELVLNVGESIWSSYESFTHDTGIKKTEDLYRWHSISQVMAGSPSSPRLVSTSVELGSVNTFMSFTQGFLLSPQFSFASNSRIYHKTAK